MPPAPVMFSITICWPRISLNRAARMRASVSTGPPAAYGTTMVTARVGQSCALAMRGASRSTIPATALQIILRMSSSRGLERRHSKDSSPRILSSRPKGFHCDRDSSGAISLRADVCRADDLRPAFDLRRHKCGEIFRRAALGRHDLEAELLEPAADRRIVERVAHRLIELAHDRRRRAFRHEERVPHACLDAGQALLAGGREIGN